MKNQLPIKPVFWICILRTLVCLLSQARGLLSVEHQVKRSEAGPQMNGANFPDPCIIRFNEVWYSFATRSTGSSVHIQIAESNDFETWSLVYHEDGSQRDAMPNLPPWVNSASPNTWAPDVVQLNDGTFVMYYSASINSYNSKHCIGAATSSDILGPYNAQQGPLLCPLSQGGAIDAAGYNDHGQRYVVYKADGNRIGHGGVCSNTSPSIVPTPILLQAVEQDGVSLRGNAVILLDNDGIPDGGSIEAPSLVQSEATYVLFFSSGCYYTTNYTVNYATAPTITGPYQRADHPLFVTGDFGLVAPGGMSIYSDAKHMVFHANYGGGRALYNAAVSIRGNQVTLEYSQYSVHGTALMLVTVGNFRISVPFGGSNGMAMISYSVSQETVNRKARYSKSRDSV